MFVTKLKTTAMQALALTMIVGAVGAFSSHLLAMAPAPKQADKEDIQGTWVAVSAEADGKKLPQEAVKDFTVIITANRIVFNPKGENRASSYKLDPTKSPKVFEATPLDGPAKGKPQPAIYELKGDLLKLCVQNGEGPPPTEFGTNAGDRLRLLILKRVKK